MDRNGNHYKKVIVIDRLEPRRFMLSLLGLQKFHNFFQSASEANLARGIRPRRLPKWLIINMLAMIHPYEYVRHHRCLAR
jgi:hypothetical protein